MRAIGSVEFARQPCRDLVAQRRLVGLQPTFQVAAIQQRLWVTEFGDESQDLEKMRLLVRLHRRHAYLKVALNEVRGDVTPHDIPVAEREFRIFDGTPDHLVRIGKVVLVMVIGAPERDDGRDGVAAARAGGMFRSATPLKVPMSIPTSMVVVQLSTSIAGRSILSSSGPRSTSWNSSSCSSDLE